MVIKEVLQDTPLKLLIVDDDDVDRERIRRMLRKAKINASISEASSIEDSMTYLNKDEYDCVIIDYRLGAISGLSLLNMIRTKLGSHCAVIMITGLGSENVAAEAMRLGASDYLQKNQLNDVQLVRAILSSVHRAELEKKLHDMAHYDNLTGLASRPLLLKKLQQSITHSEVAAVAFLDLDNFKPINDNYGHDTGDLVLVTIANRLKKIIRRGDTLARLGGDEFVLLLKNMSNTDECNYFLNRIIRQINAPIELTEYDSLVQVSASVGVAMVGNTSLDADTILRRADQTMYQAKGLGSNNVLFFDPEEEQRQHQRRALLQEAERGIFHNEFVLHYQPQVDMINHQLIGVEALIRWNHPTLGLLYPAEFSSALEHANIGILIGEWVLQEALKQNCLWQDMNLTVSVNIAPAHLLSKGFVERLDLLLQHTPNIDPKRLELEVLETVSIHDINNAVEILKGCRELGVSVALDDFGTGYASLSYLKKLPLNTLKIDRSFVKNILSNQEDRSIVTCVVALSQAFSYNLIAEGIESMDHEQALIDMGCHIGQGYFIAKPMSAEQMTQWANEYNQQVYAY
ncbi:GGDEF domain-containing response regulator [Marinomonas transparens]|uniref:GGDEF domain-containing response regulator n=1 Tax=Marinomonas transparens TaxID=2795388 RepID=A0A934N1A5_9GAMM|nr:GGDEF domain-containing response regulator [Marinomonas transparens]MBJ7539320.1 GGDEF domain-containing response regulator [Marinomonas transparens]